MIGAVTGMQAEAALLPGVRVVCSGGNAQRARELADRLLAEGADALLSFGIAGGLLEGLPPGSLVVASGVATGGDLVACDAAWSRAMLACLPQAREGVVAGVAEAVATPIAKRRLHESFRALAVDMESGAVAAACAAAGRPFAVLRAVADPVERAIPAAALVGLAPDGRTTALPVIAGLLRRPADLPGVIRLGLDTKAALRALRLAVGRLGPTLGFQLV
jgi:hopanoid-associated phosphorylase